MTSASRPDVRAYLEIRTAASAGFDPTGRHLLIRSDLSGTGQLYRLDLDDLEAADLPLLPRDLPVLTSGDEPVAGGWLPEPHPVTGDSVLVSRDTGGDEHHQLFTLDAHDPSGGLRDLVVAPGAIHRPGGVSRDGRWLAYSTNARNGRDFDVHVRDLLTGDDERVWAPGGWAGAGGFSPAGTWLAVWELTRRPGDNRSHLLERTTGRLVEIDPHDHLDEAAVGTPSWLPDESGFFVSTDVGRDLPVISRGRVVEDLSGLRVALDPVLDPGWPCDCAVDWSGRHLLVSTNVDGRSQVQVRDAATLAVLVDLPVQGVASGVRISRDATRVTWSQSTPSEPGDAWLHDLTSGATRRATSSPCAVDPTTFVEPEVVSVRSFDGLEVPAFVYRPIRPSADRLPVVLVLHGGPESQYRPSFSPVTQYLVANGYAVVAPNIRGSTGYGKRYEHLDDVERRLDAVADLAALHDWLGSTPDLEASRAALWGGSYGGYLVLAGLSMQPDRWAAGVDIVGISSLVTFLENTSVWRRAFREREYGSLVHHRELLEAASPITHIDAIRAPLFLVHGRNDPRVPLSEAEQVHAALVQRGVRSDLLVYDDEGHGLARLANRIDAYPRMLDFLDDVLRPQPAPQDSEGLDDDRRTPARDRAPARRDR